jgi:F0F1-type ATP synthase assembly protein I
MPFNRPIQNQPSPTKRPSSVAGLMQAEKLMQIAILLPASACVGWLIGGWADKHFHQTWIGLVGILLGGILGLIYVIRLVMTNQNSPGSDTSPENRSNNGIEEQKSKT